MDESAIDALCKRLRKHGASGFLIGDEARDALLDIRAKLAAAERENERLTSELVTALEAGHAIAQKHRAADMPTDGAALQTFFDAWLRLKDLGWKESIHAPNGPLDLIEVGSTGIHRGYCEQNLHLGRKVFWIRDGHDTYPSQPVLFRPTPPPADAALAQKEQSNG